jgi:cytochrome c oxidase subunit 1
VVFAMFAGFYFWWPKFTGRLLHEGWGRLHFWMLFVGFHLTFLVQHWLGVEGMPRRYADYLPEDGFTVLHQISSVGAFLLGASTLPFLWNVWISRHGALVSVDDPWGWVARWSGPPAAPHPGTASRACRGSGRSLRPSISTIPKWLCTSTATTLPTRER